MLIEQHEDYFGNFDIVEVMFERQDFDLKIYRNQHEIIETVL